jgi:hypothetical protein
MNCEISSVVQRVDLRKNVMQNFLVLILPTGETVQCPVDDEVAERVMKAHIHAHAAPPVIARLEEVPIGDADVVTSARAYIPHEEEPPAHEESDYADDGVPSV